MEFGVAGAQSDAGSTEAYVSEGADFLEGRRGLNAIEDPPTAATL